MTEVSRPKPRAAARPESPSPVERFQRKWREVPAPEQPVSPTPEQHRRYNESMARQAEIERERWAFTARRRNYQDELDTLFNLSGDARVEFARLHERPQGNEACVAVVLRYAFACHLDRVRGERLRNARLCEELPGGEDLLRVARRALAEAEPDLSYVVEATCFCHPSRTEQALATELGLHQSSVGRRKWRGLAWLRSYLRRQLEPDQAAG